METFELLRFGASVSWKMVNDIFLIILNQLVGKNVTSKHLSVSNTISSCLCPQPVQAEPP